jgi:ankyrin repeat protein
MKKFFTIVLLFAGLYGTKGQETNTLLGADFWKQKPSIEQVKAEMAKGNSATATNERAFDVVTNAISASAPLETIKFLVELDGNGVHKLTHDGRTYLHWATSAGNVDLIKYLISKGADIRYKDSKGAEPIVFGMASASKNTAIFDAYFAAGLPITASFSGGANLMLLAVSNDVDLKATNYFLSKGLSLQSKDAEGNTLFDYAAKSTNIDLLKSVLAKGVKASPAALIFASEMGGRGASSANLDFFKYLVEDLKLNPTYNNAAGNNVLHGLVRKPNQNDIVNYFLAKGVDVNKANDEGNTPFMLAAGTNQLALVEAMAAKVKDINLQNKAGESALTFAANRGSQEVFAFLLKNGANAKLTDQAGNNLAYHVVQHYRPNPNDKSDVLTEKLNLLQANGLNLAAQQKDGNTLLHTAVANNNLAIVKKLASYKINLNAVNQEGNTVLHKAALISKKDELLKYLVALGADKKIKTEFGETAYDLASENEFLTKAKVSLDFLKN